MVPWADWWAVPPTEVNKTTLGYSASQAYWRSVVDLRHFASGTRANSQDIFASLTREITVMPNPNATPPKPQPCNSDTSNTTSPKVPPSPCGSAAQKVSEYSPCSFAGAVLQETHPWALAGISAVPRYL